MRKILLFALMLAYGSVNAQITRNNLVYSKPQKGDWTTEVNFRPNLFGGNLFDLNDNNYGNFDLIYGFKARHFNSEKKATRFGANLIYINANDYLNQDFDLRLNLISLNFGREYHLAGAERLSTYCGYEASAGYAFEKVDTGTGEVKLQGYQLGFRALIGADYYIMPNLYLGTELAYGLDYLQIDLDDPNNLAENVDMNMFRMGNQVNANFRLGWRF